MVVGPNSALCFIYNLYKSQFKITWVWGRVSALKNIWTSHKLLMYYSFYMARIELEMHYVINCLHFWLFFFMFQFSLQILLSMEWFIWGQVLQRVAFWDQKWSRLLRLQYETFKVIPSPGRHLLVYGVIWPMETPYILLWSSF